VLVFRRWRLGRVQCLPTTGMRGTLPAEQVAAIKAGIKSDLKLILSE
jgi:hypothetical protein